MSHVLDKKDFGPAGFKWLTLKRIMYEDPKGRKRIWESAERTTRAECGVDGVAILARVFSESAEPQVILEAQFRAPQSGIVVELPAGLIDAGESAAQAAVRELREETGYSGRVVEESPICWSDPGMTNANMQVVVIDVDGDAPANVTVHPELEDGEFIDVFLLPLAGLYEALLALRKEKGWELDARLLMYAQGLQHTQHAQHSKQAQPASANGLSQLPMTSAPETESTSAASPAAGTAAGPARTSAAGKAPQADRQTTDGLSKPGSHADVLKAQPVAVQISSLADVPAVLQQAWQQLDTRTLTSAGTGLATGLALACLSGIFGRRRR